MSSKANKKKKHKDTRARPAGMSEKLQERLIVAVLIALPFILYYRYVFGGAMLYSSDLMLAGYAQREFIAQYIFSHGRLPLWDPHVFGGMPTVAAFYGDVFYPTTLFRIFIPVRIVWSWTFAGHIALAGVATFYFCKDLGLNRYASAVGALGYMFCGSLVSMTAPGHDTKMICASLLPLAFLLLNRAMNKGKLYQFIFAGATVGFSFLAGHVQATYYMVISLFIFFLFRLFGMWRDADQRGRIKKVIVYSVLAVFFMVCLISIQYLPVYKNMPFAARGAEKGYAWSTSWSLPTSELIDLVTPHFSGLGGKYWGTNYFKLDSQYLGILPLLLAPLALLGRKPRNVKFFVALLLLGVIMALGGHTPLYRLAYYIIPGVKKFRGPATIFYIASFSMNMLSAFGVAHLMQDLKDRQKRKIYTYLLIALGVIFLFAIICAAGRQSVIQFISNRIGPYVRSSYSPELAANKIANLRANYPYFLKGLSWATFLFAANAGLIYLLATKKLARETWTVVACLLLLVDLWIFDNHFIRQARRPSDYFAQDEVVRFLKTRRGLFRAFPFRYENTNNDFLKFHDIQSVAGYHGNALQSYQDFTGAGSSVMFAGKNLHNKNFMDVLNVKFLISVPLPEDVSRFDARTRKAIESLRKFFQRENFREVFRGRAHAVYENTSALNRATLVPGYQVLPRDKILDRLRDDSFDPRDVVILEEEIDMTMPGGEGPVGEVVITEYGPNRMVMKADTRHNSILLLSENFYDQWQARVDGKKVKIYRANYTFRGVPLPAGSHTVQLDYDSPAMKLGLLLSTFSFVLLIICIVVWGRNRKKR